MTNHRSSYWKTELLALTTTLASGLVIGWWLAKQEILLPGAAWSSEHYPALYWVLVPLVGIVCLVSLLITLGGALCLYEDSKQSSSSS